MICFFFQTNIRGTRATGHVFFLFEERVFYLVIIYKTQFYKVWSQELVYLSSYTYPDRGYRFLFLFLGTYNTKSTNLKKRDIFSKIAYMHMKIGQMQDVRALVDKKIWKFPPLNEYMRYPPEYG